MTSIQQNLNNIRKWLAENDLDIFIIPHADEYLSEYIPPENERLAWATGFTGSAGMAIISKDTAAIFVDGRYTVQVKEQVDSNLYKILHISNDPWMKWLKDNHKTDATIGYDPRMHRANWIKITEKKLNGTLKLEAVSENPIDLYWENRPKSVDDKAILLSQKYTGKSSLNKRLELGKVIADNGCKAAFITQLDSIAWLLNIRGVDVPCNPVLLSHGILYADGAFDLFIPENKIPDGFQHHVGENVQVFSPDDIQSRISELSGNKVQFDAANSNVWAKNILSNSNLNIVEKDDPCTLPKACKNEVEIQGMKNCHIRDAVAECNFLAWVDSEVGKGNLHDEGILADKLDSLRAEQADFRGISFGTISAAGSNAAMCHYSHKNYDSPGKLEMDSVYLVDSGGQYLDGTTDITRTVAIGSPSPFTKKAFTLVLKGHIALGAAQFPEGIGGQHLDTLARQFLWHEGLDFDHGTGHGVGSYLNVHEGPHRIGKGSNNVPLKEGMVVSNEPGYYEEGQFGIRIENLVFVKQKGEVNGKKLLGFENLTFVPVDTRLLDHSILTRPEKDWLNVYHLEVLEKVGPLVDGATKKWLEKAVQKV
jgi:Xaa-Pro aminopeptidase|tara:strand:- start:6037 stop:7815 length:1779 start_codon:yes stop_codon:yes gene_type:complete